ncbi:serine protease snake [Chelonus insularis]|uniref:serine protease snake n=1 Tax=Chelonus insularis TaxID=460826 RepID=UPI00158A261E|nr:serine protease snake [Chelonus insularis]
MIFYFIKKKILIELLIFIHFLLLHETTSSKRISQKKCEQYANLVYHEEESPVLRIDVGQKKITSKCGIVETPLIVGGVKAKPMEFPHMAMIGYGKDVISWQCGGSVISEDYILTAAHCINSTDKGPAIKVRVGTISTKALEPTMQERDIVERIGHPEYRLPLRYNDIALLKLDQPLDFNEYIRPACLEVESMQELSMTRKLHFIASGFGKTAYEADYGSDDLMKVTLDYISPETCQRNYQSEVGSRQMPQGLIPSMLCAGIMEGGKDTCQGDSGGPLQRVLHTPYCMYSIVGVTSFGKFCAFKNSPAIYTQVSSYLDWIEHVVWTE